MKEGDRPQRISQVTEIWKARCGDEAVALKVIRISRDDPRAKKARAVSVPQGDCCLLLF